MKKFSRMIVLVLIVVMAICVFAACNPKDGDPAGGNGSDTTDITVTFNFSGEGEDVVKTGKAGDALEAPAAGDTQNYYFGGWHLKQDFSDDAQNPTVFPSKNATYFAEWDLGYAFKASLEQADGGFEADATYDVVGKTPKGTTDSVTLSANELASIEGYSLEKNSYTVTFEQGKRDAECDVKYLLHPLKVTYVTGIGDDIVEDVKYGALAIGEDKLGGFKHRRFLGWSKTEGGEAEYAIGDSIKEQGELTLYAIWEIGLADVFGGEDTLYVSKTEQNVVYLERYGSDETLKGTVEGDLFSVKVTDSFTLDGVMLESGFYYFKDTLERTYENRADSSESIQFVSGGKGRAILKKTGNADVEGRYEFDPESSCYTFVPASGTSFLFKLTFEGEEAYFERADENVRGSYIIRYGNGSKIPYIVFDFDGFGGIDAHSGGTHIEGSYEWDDVQKVYYVALKGDEIAVRLSEEDAGEIVDGSTLKGTLVQRDGVQGSYGPAIEGKIQKDRNAKNNLTLDGFGKGTYNDVDIEYTIEVSNWYEESAYDDEYYGVAALYRVTFTYQGKSVTLCIEDSQSYNDNFYIPAIGDFEVEYFSDTASLATIYESNGFESYENTYGVLMYKYGKGEGAIVSVFSMYQGNLTGTEVYTEIDWGIITTEDNVTYRYKSTYDYFGDTNDAEFEFRYAENSSTSGVQFINVQLYKNDLVVSGNLTIDKFGHVEYKGVKGLKDLTYNYDDGLYSSFIMFHEVPDDTGNGTHTETYRVKFDEDGNITGFDFLNGFHMITDTLNGCSIATIPTADANKFEAYIGFPQGSEYYYIIKGTATLNSGNPMEANARYSFAIDPETEEETTKFLEAQGEDVMALLIEYYSFNYAINVGENDCRIVKDGFTVSNKAGNATLTFDGDENTMTLTRDGKNDIADTFVYLLEDVLVMYVIRGGVRYDIYLSLTLGENGAITDFTVGGDEANRYYSESTLGSGLEDYGRLFILFGGGKAVMSNAGMSIEAVYEATGNTFEWNGFTYTEYEIGVCYDSQDDIPDIFYYIAATTEDFNLEGGLKWHGGKYREKAYSEGEFEIVGGGSISCNGYDLATYTDAAGNEYDATMYYVDIFDRDFYEDTYPEFPEEDGPTDHIYIAYYDENGEFIKAMLFDVKNGKLDERDAFSGVYVEVSDNAPSSREIYLYLDGQGVATIYDSDDQPVETGKYSLVPELGEQFLSYVPDDAEHSLTGPFEFWIYRMDGIRCYIIYDEADTGVFHGESGELLITDGFAQGVYRDKYGVVTEGLCTYLTPTQVEFTPYGETERRYYELNKDKKSFSIGSMEWLVDGNKLVRYNGTNRDITELPAGITEIAAKAFQNSNIRSINLGSVTIIGAQAFEYCENLATVIAPNVKSVGIYAFAGCFALTTIDMPLAETIGDGAFEGAPLNSVKLKNIKQIGQYAFSHESSVSTVFDLTECATLNELKASDEAFYALIDNALTFSPINMNVYVKDVAALNLLISNANASVILKNTAGLHLANDPMKDVVYIGFTNRSVYVFDGGTLVMRQGKSSRIYGVYVASETTGIDIYVRGGENGTGNYERALESVKADNTLTFEDEILFKNGVEHTVKTQDGATTVKFTFSAEVNAAFGSITVTAKLNNEDAVTAILSAENGTLRLAVGQDKTQYYDVKVISATLCEVSPLGNMIKIATEDLFYQFTGFVKEGKITELLSFGFHSGDSVDSNDEQITTPNYSNRTISNIVIDESGKVTFDWWYYSDEYVTFTMRYVEANNTIEAAPIKWSYVSSHITGDGTADMNFTFDLTDLKVDPDSITYFAYTSRTGIMAEPVEEQIVSVTIKEYHADQSQAGQPAGVTVLEIVTENGKYTVTVTAARAPEGSGGMTTYFASCTVSRAE